MTTRDADRRIREIAARQHGVVGRRQLLGAGVSTGAIDHRLRGGALRPLHRGVYQASPIPGRYQREMAAVLACGPGAVASDHSAGAVWSMMPPPQPEAPVDVAGPRSLRGPAAGVRLHRRGGIRSDEVARKGGLPLTTPARTLLDLASSLGPFQLERVLARAQRRRLVELDAVADLLLRHPSRPGSRTLRALLSAASEPSLTRSEPEARFLSLLRKGGVPRPRTNAIVAGLEVDFLWPDRGLVAEVDGFAFHGHRSAFESDRRRDGALAAEGLTVIRFTWRQIHAEPDKVLVKLAMALGAGGGAAASEA